MASLLTRTLAPALPRPGRAVAAPAPPCGRKGSAMHLEVHVGDEEAPELAVKRFRRSAADAHVVMEARRRRQFENSQDRAKRKDKECRMRRSKKYQYGQSTAEEGAASLEPAPFAEFFSPAADAFVGSLSG